MDQTNPSQPQSPASGTPDRAALDAELMREIEDALGDMSLEDMMNDRSGAMRGAAPVKGERQLRTGTIFRVHDGEVYVEFDPKRQGVCPVTQFEQEPKPGEKYDFFEERFDPFEGLWVISRPGATHKGDLDNLSAGMIVEARCVGMNKGGLDMEVSHHKAFMPAGQVDIRHIEDISVFLGEKFPCKIIELRREKGRMVLSRKAVILEERARMRDQVLAELEVGQTKTATITSLQQYGAFADIGGVDGLIHIGDISHERIKDPSEVLKAGQVVQVKVLRIDRESKPIKIALGLKQTMSDPALNAMGEIEAGATLTGRVTKLMDFGAFVEVAPGIEGLIHVSEMSWTERVKHPSKLINVGDEVECKVLEVDSKNKRISLGLKQLQSNPWDELELKHPVGTQVEGEVKSVTDFGVFVDIGLGIDGLVHISDLAWTKKFAHPSEKYKKGDKIRATVLGIDKANEKFSLGVKQLERDPWDNIKTRYKVGTAIDGSITKLTDFGAFVELEEGIEGLIYVSEIADHRIEKPSDVLKVGDKVRAEILSIEPKDRRIGLSIKQLGRSEERANYEKYMGESSKKTSMGDLLGDKLKAALGGKKDE